MSLHNLVEFALPYICIHLYNSHTQIHSLTSTHISPKLILHWTRRSPIFGGWPGGPIVQYLSPISHAGLYQMGLLSRLERVKRLGSTIWHLHMTRLFGTFLICIRPSLWLLLIYHFNAADLIPLVPFVCFSSGDMEMAFGANLGIRGEELQLRLKPLDFFFLLDGV